MKTLKVIMRNNREYIVGIGTGFIIVLVSYHFWKSLSYIAFGEAINNLSQMQLLLSVFSFAGITFTLGWSIANIVDFVHEIYLKRNKQPSV